MELRGSKQHTKSRLWNLLIHRARYLPFGAGGSVRHVHLGLRASGEAAIEISRWGDPAAKNAQYILQPHYVAANVDRFTAPSGALTHSFHWEPGRMSFRTTRGPTRDEKAPVIAEHVFTSGIPVPGIESVRMNLYVYSQRSKVAFANGAEVVIEKFEYLP